MSIEKKRVGSVLLAAVLASICAAAREPRLVEKVRDGKLTEARASWWGFDAEDSTDALQAALSSGVKRLIVDRQDGPWIVTPLKVESNQEIFFEDGVEVLAKRGEFKGRNDTLFSLTCVSNVTLRGYGATLRMRRDDYDAPPYTKAEWRHVLGIRGCADIKVLGLTLTESGGDGIYLGSVKGAPHNRNILIKDVVCDKNYRQGISVISVQNLLIDNTVLSNTGGTAPAAGIDFEPNHPEEVLKNVVMRGCTSFNNQGDGYLFALHQLRLASVPVSVRLERCSSGSDRSAVNVITRNHDDEAVRGNIDFTDCDFRNARLSGISVRSKPSFGVSLDFVRCSLEKCGTDDKAVGDIVLSNRGGDESPVGGIRFFDLKVEQPYERPWVVWQNNVFADQGISALEGRAVVLCSGKSESVELTPEWLQQVFPPRFAVRVPRASFDWSKAAVRDDVEGLKGLTPLRIRKKGSYYFYAKAGVETMLTGEQIQVGRYEPGTKDLLVRSLDGEVVKKFRVGGFGEPVSLVGTPEKSGFYILEVDVGANAFRLKSANVPVALASLDGGVNLIASEGTLAVPVPAGTELFAFDISGAGSGEGVKAMIIDPLKKLAWKQDLITEVQRFTADGSKQELGGIWKIRVMKPEGISFEDYSVTVLGVPPFLFLRHDRYWEF